MCYAALFYDQQSHTSTIHGCCHGNSVIFDLYFLWIIQNTIPHVLLLVSMSQLRPTTRLTTATMSANAVSRDMPGSASWPIGKTPFLIVKSRRQTRYLWGTKRSTVVYSALGRLDAGSLAVGQVFQSEIEISVAERTVVLLPSGWHYITL